MGDKFQTEIDELLKNAIGGEKAETSPDVKGDTPSKVKTYKFQKDNNNFRYPSIYYSPVVKNGTYIFNPTPEDIKNAPEGKPVVISLDNWNRHYMSQKKKGD